MPDKGIINNKHNKKEMKTALKKNLKAGFSLVEMLVVIAVIGIMAAIAVPTIGNMTAQAKLNKNKRNAQSAASVWASAQAAGSTQLAGQTDVAGALTLLAGGTIVGDAAAGFDTTDFIVPLTATEQANLVTAALLTYDNVSGSLTYTP